MPLFYVLENDYKIFRVLRNNVLQAFKISRFCFFDLGSDLGCPKASELENPEKKPTNWVKFSEIWILNFKYAVLENYSELVVHIETS